VNTFTFPLIRAIFKVLDTIDLVIDVMTNPRQSMDDYCEGCGQHVEHCMCP
jgi:DTW domain-containing protein YfiP